jgi:hypothetical protein
MATFLRERLLWSAQAIALRLRLSDLLKQRSLPDLLGSLTPDVPGSRGAPLSVALSTLSMTEGALGRLRAVPDTCLYRALARYAVLRGAGHPARFVMAVDPRREEVAGHAWVELDGEPLGEAVDPGLVVTYSYPTPSSAGAR